MELLTCTKVCSIKSTQEILNFWQLHNLPFPSAIKMKPSCPLDILKYVYMPLPFSLPLSICLALFSPPPYSLHLLSSSGSEFPGSPLPHWCPVHSPLWSLCQPKQKGVCLLEGVSQWCWPGWVFWLTWINYVALLKGSGLPTYNVTTLWYKVEFLLLWFCLQLLPIASLDYQKQGLSTFIGEAFDCEVGRYYEY